MTSIRSLTIEVPDPQQADHFYDAAFALDGQLQTKASDAPTDGFRGFTVSLITSQPANVDALLDSALAAGATTLKPVKKSFWGYGAVVQAPDGTIWKIATSNKKNNGEASKKIDAVVLLLGVDDVRASKQFYVDRGIPVAKSFGSKYVQFETGSSPVGLGLYGRKALARDAGVAAEGGGSHRLVIGGDGGSFSDPDGFDWE